MKKIMMFVFIGQISSAQIATNGGFLAPLQMSSNAISAALSTVKNDWSFLFWTIKTITLESTMDMVKVELISDQKICKVVLYKIYVDTNEEYKALLLTDLSSKCSK